VCTVKLRKRTSAVFFKDMAYDAELERDAQRRQLLHIRKRKRSLQLLLGDDNPPKTVTVASDDNHRVLRSSRPNPVLPANKDDSRQRLADDSDSTQCNSDEEEESPSCTSRRLTTVSPSANYSLRTRTQQSPFNSPIRRRRLRTKSTSFQNTDDIVTPDRITRFISKGRNNTAKSADEPSPVRRSSRKDTQHGIISVGAQDVDESNECIHAAKTPRQHRNAISTPSKEKDGNKNSDAAKESVVDNSYSAVQVKDEIDLVACIPDMEPVVTVESVRRLENDTFGQASSSQQMHTTASNITMKKTIIRRRRTRPRDYLQDIRIKKLMRRRRQLAREEAEAAGEDGSDKNKVRCHKHPSQQTFSSIVVNAKAVSVSYVTCIVLAGEGK
jgi:hypothetical protein